MAPVNEPSQVMNSVKRQITPLKPTSLPQIVIVDAWCKGCAICVEFCPKHVFVMKDNLPVVVDLQACNRCMLCEMRCPDFSLTVE